jgi:protease IV
MKLIPAKLSRVFILPNLKIGEQIQVLFVNFVYKLLRSLHMKEFFKFMLASMLGFFLVIVILFFISLGILVTLVSVVGSEQVIVSSNSVLKISLDKPVLDRTPKNPFFIDLGSGSKRIGLNDILKNIKKAKSDDNIKGIFLDISYIPAGLATIDEIRNALIDFKKSGKPVISYSEMYTQAAYYLATVSDRIYLHPQGMMLFKGINAEMLFLKGTLDKLDIKMQVVRHGKFKAATEPLFLDKMSPENRQQISGLINVAWNKVLNGISATRNIPVDALNLMADSLTAESSENALKYKLVDGLVYKDELLKELKLKFKLPEKKEISFMDIDKYSSVMEKSPKKTGDNHKIAIIYATGAISEGEGNDQNIGSDRFAKAIRKAREDDRVKAIVFRINSPGGSALASDIIWREVMLTVKEKPVIASFGDVAASGGYYIACPATKILADPATITGSIGVFGVVPNFKGFFNNKLGMTFDNVKTNSNSEYIPVTQPLSAYQAMILQRDIEKIYSTFISKVAEGRHLTREKVDSIGQGRVWSGSDAKSIGLIDDFGGLDQAVELAAKLANVTDYRLIGLPEQKEPIQEFIDQLTGNTTARILEKELGENYKYYQYIRDASEIKGIQMRMPFEIIMN